MISRKSKHIALIILSTILLASILVQPLDFVKIISLKGYFVAPKDSAFSTKSWFDGSFQSTKEERLKHTLRTRPLLVRTYNQIWYWLDGYISARNVAIGENGYYYEKHYIAAYLGLDFIGEDSITKKVSEFQRLVDTLKTKGVSTLLLLAPGKVTVLPEYIPQEFSHLKRKTTNYDVFSKKLHESTIPYIDFNNYFISIKDSVQYPIYPKGGTHWSIYGSFLAVDTMLTYIEYLTKMDLPDYNYPVFDITSKPRSSDNDIAKATNRIWLNEKEKLLYPYLAVIDDSTKTKPCLLTVGDSYYWMLVNSGIQKQFFTDFNFWYYFKENFSSNSNDVQMVSSYTNLKHQIEKRDIIILIITDGNLNEFSWGFAEKILELYDN
ncbi:MAG: hypothetical protein HN431_10645 [Bacteroidetes bacterium]|nr:hypothetical protein [Bacteroidota bacterium]